MKDLTPMWMRCADVVLGVAIMGADELLSSAIARADRAMYQSKAQGRNRVTVAE